LEGLVAHAGFVRLALMCSCLDVLALSLAVMCWHRQACFHVLWHRQAGMREPDPANRKVLEKRKIRRVLVKRGGKEGGEGGRVGGREGRGKVERG